MRGHRIPWPNSISILFHKLIKVLSSWSASISSHPVVALVRAGLVRGKVTKPSLRAWQLLSLSWSNIYLKWELLVAVIVDYSYLMFHSFHDKYWWEIWKNRAVKSAGVGAKYKCWPPIAQSETPGLLFFENCFNEGRYISQSTKSFQSPSMSFRERGKVLLRCRYWSMFICFGTKFNLANDEWAKICIPYNW